jgi:hypothetical protein
LLGKTNFSKARTETPTILEDPANLEKIAALGSFIFVPGGSLYDELKRRGIEVKPGDSYNQ